MVFGLMNVQDLLYKRSSAACFLRLLARLALPLRCGLREVQRLQLLGAAAAAHMLQLLSV